MQKWKLGFATGAITLLLAACGQQEASPEADPAAEAPAQTAEAAPTAPDAADVTTTDGTSLAEFSGDAANGEKLFLQCRTCHTLDPGVNRMGPSLAGIVGRAAGSAEGFKNYSDGNANSPIVWTPEKLNQFLENPRRVIPGTRMAFGGLRDGQERADLIAYLQAQ